MTSHAAALFAEGLLLSELGYRPVWNQSWISGVGSSRDQGRSRREQRRSAFAAVHGRTGCPEGEPRRSYDELVDMIEAHLTETVRSHRLVAGTSAITGSA